MSRKWERMVERNTKSMNRLRAKSGKAPIGTKTEAEPIKGRSWVFPLVLVVVGLLFGVTIPPEARGALHQITIALYLLLALFHFFLRRPFLKATKNELVWRTYAGDRTVKPGDVATITIGDRKSVVVLKDGKTKRSFSRWYHLYPMDEVNKALSSFAAAHGIPVNGQEKGGASAQ